MECPSISGDFNNHSIVRVLTQHDHHDLKVIRSNTLYPGKKRNGPYCFPYSKTGEKDRCSYSPFHSYPTVHDQFISSPLMKQPMNAA